MAARSVYSAINAVAADLAQAGVPKTRTNSIGDYQYRSIDDVVEAVSPLLARHRLCLLARALERTESQRNGTRNETLISVTVRVAYTLTSVDDGSSHVVETFGEALDDSDKATAKALSHVPEPIQGWPQWVADIRDIIDVCETDQAIKLVQDRYRELLKALSRERPDLYGELGKTVNARREFLACPEEPKLEQRRAKKANHRKGQRLEAVSNA